MAAGHHGVLEDGSNRAIDRSKAVSDDLHLNVGHHSLMPRDSKRDLFQDQQEHLS
jgi:hypothetical protein